MRGSPHRLRPCSPIPPSVPPRAAAVAAASPPPHVPLAAVTRGDVDRRVHCGSVAVVDRDGRLLYAAGDPRVPDDDAQRAEAVPGDAVRRRRRRRALRLLDRRRSRCCARATPASRGTSTAVADMLAQRRQRRRRPAVRHARARASTSGAARCRRRRRTRRSRTTARASTAACSRTACLCGLPKESYLDFDHPLQAGDPARGRALHGDAGGGPRRRHRRLLGARTTRCRSRGSRSPSRGLPRRARRRRVRAAPRRARRRDDRAPGDGVRRGAQRPRADARRARRLGHQDRRRGRPGDRHPRARASGIAIKVADGAKRGLHPAIVAVLDQLGLLDDERRAELARLARAGRCATTAGIVTGRHSAAGCPGQIHGHGAGGHGRRHDHGAGVNFPRVARSVVQACAARRPGGALVEGPGRAGAQKPAAAPAVRRA